MVANCIGMEILLTPWTSQFLKYYPLIHSKTSFNTTLVLSLQHGQISFLNHQLHF